MQRSLRVVSSSQPAEGNPQYPRRSVVPGVRRGSRERMTACARRTPRTSAHLRRNNLKSMNDATNTPETSTQSEPARAKHDETPREVAFRVLANAIKEVRLLRCALPRHVPPDRSARRDLRWALGPGAQDRCQAGPPGGSHGVAGRDQGGVDRTGTERRRPVAGVARKHAPGAAGLDDVPLEQCRTLSPRPRAPSLSSA